MPDVLPSEANQARSVLRSVLPRARVVLVCQVHVAFDERGRVVAADLAKQQSVRARLLGRRAVSMPASNSPRITFADIYFQDPGAPRRYGDQLRRSG